MEMSPSIAHLADALSKAQSQMKEVLKTKTAQVKSDKGSYSYKYAELVDLLEAVKPALFAHGLAISQGADTFDRSGSIEPGRAALTERGVKVTTLLMHSSGEYLSSSLALPVQGSTPQAFGSAITYARRYALSALLGVAPEDDDDAEAASSSIGFPASQQAPRPTPTAAGLSRTRASEIHAALGKRGLPKVDDHYRFASELLGREVRNFTELSEEDAEKLSAAARA